MSKVETASPSRLLREKLAQLEKFGNEHGASFLRKPKTVRTVQGIIAAGLALQQKRLDAMAKILAAADMPSRTEVEALGARLGAIEASIARIEAALAPGASQAAERPRPSRNRKPPKRA